MTDIKKDFQIKVNHSHSLPPWFFSVPDDISNRLSIALWTAFSNENI